MLNDNFMLFLVTNFNAIFAFRSNIEMSKKIVRALESMCLAINGKGESTREPIPFEQ